MIYHVLPGDSLVEEFRKSGITGEVIVCREALVSGPIDAENLNEFWDQRARFVLAEYAEDEIDYHEKVADALSRLVDVTGEDEVNLWFEYELFCSVNMWFCLSLLSNTDAAVYRVEPIGLDMEDRWEGFGKFDADDLKACFELRTALSSDDVKLGASLWDAYRRDDSAAMYELSNTGTSSFPYLKEVARAAADEDLEPLEVLRTITRRGEADFGRIFTEFKRRAGVYGYGDLQVQALLDRLHS
ncbi:MAG: DUF1835 domain-containing protein [Pyrinomonadaceae bacterium]